MNILETALIKSILIKTKEINHIYSEMERCNLNEEIEIISQMIQANTNKINYNGLTYTYDINFLRQIKKELGGIRNGNQI